DRGIEEEPDHVAFLDLVLADQELAATSRGLPGDALERIAEHMVADFAEVRRLPAPARTSPRERCPSRRERVGARCRGLVDARSDLDTEWVGERQGHFEQPWAAAQLERQAVQAMAPDTRRTHEDGYAEASARG